MKWWLVLLLIPLISTNVSAAETSCVILEEAAAGPAHTCSPCLSNPGNCTPCGTSTNDCDGYNTNPGPHLVTSQSSTRVIQVVWHIILGPSGEGDCSAQVASQMQLLNDAYGAKSGTPYASSVNTHIQFVLSSKDPSGNPTTGIEIVSNHPEWFNTIYVRNSVDQAAGTALHWDTTRYLNIITHGNTVGSWSALPWDATDTPYFDGVRLLYSLAGTTDNGRILVHEIGHFLGLFEEGWNVCGTTCNTSCYQTGDLVCDTPTWVTCNGRAGCENFPILSCSVYTYGNTFVGQGQPPCWIRWTAEQTARMRCSLPTYRPNNYLGIVESSIQETVTQFCSGPTSRIRFVISWDTNVATNGPDSLLVYPPGWACPGPTWRKSGVTPGSATTQHTVTWEGNCSPGAVGEWRYTIKTMNAPSGILSTRSECRPIGAVSCPSCGGGCHPPCEFD